MSMGDLTSADIPIIIQKYHLCVCNTSGLGGLSDPTAHKKIPTSCMKAEDEKEHLKRPVYCLVQEIMVHFLAQLITLNIKHYR